MSNRDIYFVETNNVKLSNRLFIKLSTGDILYFGDDVNLCEDASVYPHTLYFYRNGDRESKIYRQLEIKKIGMIWFIVENIINNGTEGQKQLVSYEYALNTLLRNTQDQDVGDNSYWGEYNALKGKPLLLPTFPTYAKIVNK